MNMKQALMRFIVIVVISWLFMFFVPMKWFLTYFLPMSFFLLMGLVTFGVCGLGWPFAAPAGMLWKPDNRVVPGILMIIVWIVLAVVLAWVEANVYPKIPLFPAGLWFGVIIFGLTLWYTFDGVGPHPFKQPWLNWLFASALILILACIIWAIFVNYNGTPLEKHPSNPGGLFPGPWWFGLVVWIIVWVQVFGGPMCLQGWPFYKLPAPLYQIVLTAVVIVLWLCVLGGFARNRFEPRVLVRFHRSERYRMVAYAFGRVRDVSIRTGQATHTRDIQFHSGRDYPRGRLDMLTQDNFDTHLREAGRDRPGTGSV